LSIILSVMNNMSDEDKARLGRSGSKINTDGAHLVTIVEAYEIDNQRFCLKVEDAEGKSAEWTGFFKMKVTKDDKGVVKAGEYSVNGIKTYLDTEGAEYDNLRAIGQIKNLWKIVGNNEAQFGAGIKPGTVTFSKAGTKAVENWTGLVGKKFTCVTSYLVTLDADGKRAWRNQAINMDALFTAAGLSQTEVDAGKTEGVALDAAVAAAKANAAIEFKNKNNKICMQELNLIKGAGKPPVVETATETAEDPF
jgi:hypothetical protein